MNKQINKEQFPFRPLKSSLNPLIKEQIGARANNIAQLSRMDRAIIKLIPLLPILSIGRIVSPSHSSIMITDRKQLILGLGLAFGSGEGKTWGFWGDEDGLGDLVVVVLDGGRVY